MSIQSLDLTKQAPRSPRERIGGYATLARMNDKARADIAGTPGDYHTNCPIDHILLDWKGVEYAPVRQALEAGASDEDIAKYLDTHGTQKSPEEVRAWSDEIEQFSMHGDPKKGGWFDSECQALGLDPAKSSLFDYLEADDKVSFNK